MHRSVILAFIAVAAFAVTTPAQARHHLRYVYGYSYSSQYGRYLAQRHWAYQHRHLRRYAHRRHRDAVVPVAHGTTRVQLANGKSIVVAATFAERFVGFFNELLHREGRLPEIGCASGGHQWNSLHHWGGACDVGQTARNRAWAAMYRVSDLARKWGLTDGCWWTRDPRGPDCGHVEVNRHVAQAPAIIEREAVARRPRIQFASGALQ